MRILHTIASLRPETGGPARSVPGAANALADLGVDVHVWSPDVDPNQSETAKYVLHSGSLEAAMNSGTAWDMIHDHGVWLPINHQVARMAKERGIPRIVSPRGMLEPWALNHKKWKKRVAWWLYQRRDLSTAAALHATAESEAIQLRKLGLTAPIVVVPNGVDVAVNASEEEESESLKVEGRSSSSRSTIDSQPSTSPKTALFLSRIQSKKGLPMLIQAWAKVRPQGWRMRIVGPDEDGHRAELEALAVDAGIAGEWTFEGALEAAEKEAAFAGANLFILPTYSENFGIAVAEALAAGVPVITTTGAPWQGLIENASGWWVDPNCESLAGALRDACSRDAAVLREMGDRGREWVRRDFSWQGVASRMVRAYDELLSSQ